MSCKLPLLDEEETTKSRLMTAEVELESAERFLNIARGDVVTFKDMLCTAWGLLLRCYTGQDNVSFYFRQGHVDDPVSNSAVPRDSHSTFRMSFHEQESLSLCVARAKDACADAEREGPSLGPPVSDSRSLSASRDQNTHVWIRNATCKDTQDSAVQKVC